MLKMLIMLKVAMICVNFFLFSTKSDPHGKSKKPKDKKEKEKREKKKKSMDLKAYNGEIKLKKPISYFRQFYRYHLIMVIFKLRKFLHLLFKIFI